MPPKPRRRRLSRTIERAITEAALAVRSRAWAPYSEFSVGAALLCDDGTVVTGCNVENVTYGLCVCAERTAVGTAVAAGHRAFHAIAIATGSSPPSPPCGMCRQVLAEFCADLVVVCVNPQGERVRTSLHALFPGNFTPALLRSGQGQSGQGRSKRTSRVARGRAGGKPAQVLS